MGKVNNDRLIDACNNGLISEVVILTKRKFLMGTAANVEAKDRDGFPVLLLAANQGHLEIVKLLLAAGANVNAKTIKGRTALYEASDNGRVEIVKLLIQTGVDVNAELTGDDNSIYNLTALMMASAKGHTEIVKLLLAGGAKVDTKTKSGKTALCFAANNGHKEITKILINHGSDINALSEEARKKVLAKIQQLERELAKEITQPNEAEQEPAARECRDEPIEIPSKWTPGKALKLMSYNEAIAAIKSGNPERVSEAVGSNILSAATIYNEISQSLDPSTNERLVDLLVPLLKHDDYKVRNMTPAVLELIGDDTTIPYLEEVIAHDPDSQVVKNARLAVEKIRSRHARTDAVTFIRRYTKPIDASTQGTYEEFSAPSRVVARAYLDKTSVTQDYFYIEVITPEGNIGKDKDGLY